VCSALVAALSGAYAWLVKPVLDEIFINKNETLLLVLPLALFTVSVLKSAFSYGQNYLMNYVGNQVITDIRQELFGKLVRLPVQYHDANTSGRLVSRVINDVTLMANAIAGVLKDVFQQGLTFDGRFLWSTGGDNVIYQINGRTVPDMTSTLNAIAEIPPGKTVPVRVVRRNQEVTVDVTVGRRRPRPRTED